MVDHIDLDSDGGSSGRSSDAERTREDIFGRLGMYESAVRRENETIDQKYHECNWHAHSWQLLPRSKFIGPKPGPTSLVPQRKGLKPHEYFLMFWDDVVKRKLVYESNSYAKYIDPVTGKQKGGPGGGRPITAKEMQQFLGICMLMGVRRQPVIRDY
jgi:hypothetical protein